jgi:lipid-binding SYLF domain-containing protein
MSTFRLSLLRSLMVLAALTCGVSAQARETTTSLMDRATATVEDLRRDSSFGTSPELLGRAKAIMVVPQLVKGGFIFGAEGGNGVMLARTPDGRWSNPAFFGIGAGSFGLQIGLEEAELVMFIMTNHALDAVMKNEVKLGVNAGLTVLVVGSSAEADSATMRKVDIIAWARAKGAYAGITLSGSVIKPNGKANDGYYGHRITASDILLRGMGTPVADRAGELKAALRHIERKD